MVPEFEDRRMKKLIKKNKKNLEKLFKKEGVVLAYLFGSAAREKKEPLGDVDIAVLFSRKVKEADYFDKKLRLAAKIDEILGIFQTEVVVLNQAPPLLKHRAVFRGISIFASNPKLRRDFEFRVLQEYEDFIYHLETADRIMRKHIHRGTFGKPLISLPL